MAMFAREQYPHFKEKIDQYFRNLECEISYTPKSDSTEIVKSIDGFEGPLERFIGYLISQLYLFMNLVMVPIFIAWVLCFLIFQKGIWRDYFFQGGNTAIIIVTLILVVMFKVTVYGLKRR